MKTFFSILCLLSITVLMSACDNGDSGGTSGGSGAVPYVVYDILSDHVTCYNADRSYILDPTQVCEWDCASYKGAKRNSIQLTFEMDLTTNVIALTKERVGTCK